MTGGDVLEHFIIWILLEGPPDLDIISKTTTSLLNVYIFIFIFDGYFLKKCYESGVVL